MTDFDKKVDEQNSGRIKIFFAIFDSENAGKLPKTLNIGDKCPPHVAFGGGYHVYWHRWRCESSSGGSSTRVDALTPGWGPLAPPTVGLQNRMSPPSPSRRELTTGMPRKR